MYKNNIVLQGHPWADVHWKSNRGAGRKARSAKWNIRNLDDKEK